jgi:hypothetical protein
MKLLTLKRDGMESKLASSGLIGFIIGLIFGMIIISLGSRQVIKQPQTQIDSLKKQDSIKELYRVYNIPTGADTLLKPISK